PLTLPSLRDGPLPLPQQGERDPRSAPSPLVVLSDSHIVKPQSSSVFDGAEVLQASSHDLGAGLAVVAGPSAETGDDPGGEGERALGVRIALALCLAGEFVRDGFEDGLVVRVEGIA